MTFPYKALDRFDTRRVNIPLEIIIYNSCANSVVNHDNSFEISDILMVEEG